MKDLMEHYHIKPFERRCRALIKPYSCLELCSQVLRLVARSAALHADNLAYRTRVLQKSEQLSKVFLGAFLVTGLPFLVVVGCILVQVVVYPNLHKNIEFCSKTLFLTCSIPPLGSWIHACQSPGPHPRGVSRRCRSEFRVLGNFSPIIVQGGQ